MGFLTQLAEAKAKLESKRGHYGSGIAAARAAYSYLLGMCKIKKPIPYTEKELLDKRLSEVFPNAKSMQIVELDGVKYKNSHSPISSNSRKEVTSWDQEWVKVYSVDSAYTRHP